MPAAGMAWPIIDETAPECPAPVRRRRKHGVQGTELGTVGGRDAQAVPFDEHHRGGIDPRPAIRPADRAGMAAGTGHGQAPAPSVARQAQALHDRVDPIAVALGVAPALEDEHAHAFAREHAVGVGRERPRGPRAGHRPELAEDQRESRRRPRRRPRRRWPGRPAARSGPGRRGRARPATRRWRRPPRRRPRPGRADGRCDRPWRWSTGRRSWPPRTEAARSSTRPAPTSRSASDHSGWRADRIARVCAAIRPCWSRVRLPRLK